MTGQKKQNLLLRASVHVCACVKHSGVQMCMYAHAHVYICKRKRGREKFWPSLKTQEKTEIGAVHSLCKKINPIIC